MSSKYPALAGPLCYGSTIQSRPCTVADLDAIRWAKARPQELAWRDKVSIFGAPSNISTLNGMSNDAVMHVVSKDDCMADGQVAA